MSFLIGTVVAVLLGFLAGLLSFKIKTRWCGTCGTVKSCPRCAGWASSALGASGHKPKRATKAGRGSRS